ncbi:MAG: GIY-YIG nuclease family protein [Saprospiraceae bacterium]|nr:GIY-YIG nuclease family protein [Saprospiraceae bacterium]
MYFTYIIQSQKDFRLYVGISKDPNSRLSQHNLGMTKSTKGYRPWKLLYFEEFSSLAIARNREVYFKSGAGKEDLKEILRLKGLLK